MRRSGIFALLFYFLAYFCERFTTYGFKILGTIPEKQSPKSKLTLDVWKYAGEEPHLHKIWKTVTLNIAFSDKNSLSEDDYVIYQYQNLSELTKAYEDGQKLLGFLQKWTLWRSMQISPFSPTFIGVETLKPYEISLTVHYVNFILLFFFLLGVFLFFSAKKLSRNVIAYYVGGSGVGILLSLLFILFLLYRFLPQKRTVAFLSILTGAVSLNLYIVYTLWQNLFLIFKRYQRLVAIYLVTVGSLSFAACYRFGPPRDVKSQNLIQWLIQICGLLLLYNSCQIQSISCFFIISLILAYNFQRSVAKFAYKIRFRYFPPARKLLTEEQYLKQGVVETKKALAELREYCRSPKCDSWKYASRLSTPKRFASFVGGCSHLSDDELLQHDSYCMAAADLHSEEDDDDDEEGSSADNLNITASSYDDVVRSPLSGTSRLDVTSSSSFAYSRRSPARSRDVIETRSRDVINKPATLSSSTPVENINRSPYPYSPDYYRRYAERMHNVESRAVNGNLSRLPK